MKLEKGDKVGVIAAGSPSDPELYQAGLDCLNSFGFEVIVPIDPCRVEGFFCASTTERADALMNLYLDTEVKAIFASRGGYGSIEILPHLDFSTIKNNPKPLIGYSDLTALLVNLRERAGTTAIHGANLAVEFAAYNESALAKESVDTLLSILFAEIENQEYSCDVLVDGTASGKLLVGNLSILVSLLGTEWDVDYSGKILVIEEVGEKPYKLRRMLLQLSQAGKLSQISGLVFGRLLEGAEKEHLALVCDGVVDSLGVPVLTGLGVGHDGLNLPLALDSKARIERGRLLVDELV